MPLWMEKYCDEGTICSDRRSMPLLAGSLVALSVPQWDKGRTLVGSRGAGTLKAKRNLQFYSTRDFSL